jgi:hypothetical protein
VRVFAWIAATLLALGAAGAVVSHRLSVETGQARSYVALGKSSLAGGDRASATLSFERARLLAPRAEVVRSALAGPGTAVIDSPVARAVGWVAPREWSSLAVTLGWLAGLSVAAAIGIGAKPGRAGPVARRLGLLFAVAFVLSLGGVVESSITARALAVVTAPTGALVSPYPAAGASADLHPGDAVVVDRRYRDFVEVRGPGGAHGWVPSSLLAPVVGAGA